MLRLLKSEAEIKLLRESASLTAHAIIKVRRCFLFLDSLEILGLVSITFNWLLMNYKIKILPDNFTSI